MDGKKHFREVCQQQDIDCDTYFKLGAQNCQNNAGYVYKCDRFSRKPTQLYAVNYLQNLDAYVAWSLKTSKADGYNSFRVLKSNLNALQKGKLLRIVKPLEYSGWDKEVVFAFDSTAIVDFLKVCFPEK